ncbi:hypothetical protein CDV31_012696 [Fusarium ambrosium]|uniref:Secreted protein n=1 Tax=Fusarium ambrosium TaxID=131363 RepID=A0A428T858_9HYPO|nr:hypothetical protein CDV31_012696 [Fusarium ambrosium]
MDILSTLAGIGWLSVLQTRSSAVLFDGACLLAKPPLAWRGSVLAFSVGVYCADDATGNNTDGEMMGLVLSLNSVGSGINTPLLLSQNNVSDNFICVSDVIETVIVEW